MGSNISNIKIPTQEEMLREQVAKQKADFESQLAARDQQISGQKSALEAFNKGPASGDSVSQRLRGSFTNTSTGQIDDVKQRDILAGSQFGEAVIGEGLGRLRGQEDIESVISQQKELAKGMGSDEMVARREQAGQRIDQATQGSSRAMQAALARAGVKGGAAGAKLAQVQLGGLSQKAGAERDLLIQDRAMREQSIGKLASTVGQTAQFDIAQAAKEKDISLQAGLGFAGLGAAERGAAEAAAATRAAGNARAAAACFGEHTEVLLANGKTKKITDIELGDEIHGGIVTGLFKSIVNSDLYSVDGIIVTGDHPVNIYDSWFHAKDVGVPFLVHEPKMVYDLVTSDHRIWVVSNTTTIQFSDYEGQETNSEEWLEACKNGDVSRIPIREVRD
jgi:hypothetical protein